MAECNERHRREEGRVRVTRPMLDEWGLWQLYQAGPVATWRLREELERRLGMQVEGIVWDWDCGA